MSPPVSPPVSPPAGPPPKPGETICVGTLHGVVVDNLHVPNGAFCGLADITVRGNAIAEPGSALAFGVESRVNGNVEALSGARVSAVQTVVGGNVTCLGCRLESFDLEVGGNLRVV